MATTNSTRFACVCWKIGDIKSLRPMWSNQRCADFLRANGRHIEDAMVQAGGQRMTRRFNFGFRTARRRLTLKQRKAREQLAKKHGCVWVEINQGDEWMSYFWSVNRGQPFNQQLEDALLEDLSKDTKA